MLFGGLVFHCNLLLVGQNGESDELELKHSLTSKKKFERDHEDVFMFENVLSLGELTNLRIWHDKSSAKNSWHLEYVQVDDTHTGESYMFPCNKWLSSKLDDKQLVRELVCNSGSPRAVRRGSLTSSGKVPYVIEVVTSDKDNAGTTQDGWIILEGARKRSERFHMQNKPNKKILRR